MAIEQSLFGPDAQTIQDQLDRQFVQDNSSLDLGAMSARAGRDLGKGIGGLMGLQDPRVAEAGKVQEAVREMQQMGVSMDDPAEYYRKLAGVFGAKGLTKQAEMAAVKALEYKDKNDERGFKEKDRQAQLNIKHEELAIKQAQLAKEREKAHGKPWQEAATKFLTDNFKHVKPESALKFWETLNRTEGNIILASSDLLKDEDPEKKAKLFDANGIQYVFDPAAAKANPDKVHPFLPDYVAAGRASDKATKVEVKNFGAEQESAFSREVGVLGAKKLAELDEIRASASKELAALNTLDQFTSNMRSGMGAVPLQAVDKFAAMFGGGDKLKASVNNTILFNKVVRELVASKVKQLGTNPTDSDRNFMESVLPNISDPNEAIKATISYFKTRAERTIKEAAQRMAYLHRNKGQMGAGKDAEPPFEEYTTKPNVPTADRPLQGVSDEDLMRRLGRTK